jgi:hypothetical protein
LWQNPIILHGLSALGKTKHGAIKETRYNKEFIMRNSRGVSLPSCNLLVDVSRVTIKVLRTVGIFLLLSQTGAVVSQEVKSPSDNRSNESIMSSYGFPLLSEVTHLCQEGVYADGRMRIAISHGMLSPPL